MLQLLKPYLPALIRKCVKRGSAKNVYDPAADPVGELKQVLDEAHMAATGIDLTSIMHSGGGTDLKMPRYYTRELAARKSSMARMMKAGQESIKP